MTLLNAIPFGRENARSRAEIVRLTGIPDRDMREMVKKLNDELSKHGMAVISTSGKQGYWITSNPDEMEAYVNEVRHRANQTLKNAEPVITMLYRMKNVKVVPVKAHMRRIHREPPADDKQTRL